VEIIEINLLTTVHNKRFLYKIFYEIGLYIVVNHQNLQIMKTLFFAVAISIIVIACETASSTSVEKFIPGTYVCNYYDSLSPITKTKGVDSVIIQKEVSSGSDAYEIKRFNTYQQTRDSILQPVESTNETWTGIYDKENKVIRTSPSAKILAFDMDSLLLKINGKVYKKRE